MVHASQKSSLFNTLPMEEPNKIIFTRAVAEKGPNQRFSHERGASHAYELWNHHSLSLVVEKREGGLLGETRVLVQCS